MLPEVFIHGDGKIFLETSMEVAPNSELEFVVKPAIPNRDSRFWLQGCR